MAASKKAGSARKKPARKPVKAKKAAARQVKKAAPKAKKAKAAVKAVKKRAAASKPKRPAAKAAKRRPAAKAKASKPKKAAKPAVKARRAPAAKAKPAKAAKTAAKASRAPAAKKARAGSRRTDMPPPAKSYMTVKQREWFRHKLEGMLDKIQVEAQETARHLLEQEKDLADDFDRADRELSFAVDLRENERIGNLQEKINHALRLIENGVYGYCDDCSVEIGIKRMVARPVATKCIDCKEFQENMERVP